MLGITSISIAVSYLFAYFYLLVNDRDALRSERFHLSKLAIEHSAYGDNIAGFLETDQKPSEIPAVKTEPEGAK